MGLAKPRRAVEVGLLLGTAPTGFEHHGHADTFEEAKTAVERNWQGWLAAAGLAL